MPGPFADQRWGEVRKQTMLLLLLLLSRVSRVQLCVTL